MEAQVAHILDDVEHAPRATVPLCVHARKFAFKRGVMLVAIADNVRLRIVAGKSGRTRLTLLQYKAQRTLNPSFRRHVADSFNQDFHLSVLRLSWSL